MNALVASLWSEGLKAIRSKMLPGTIAIFAFVGAMMGFMMFAAQHPEISGRSATMSAKVSAIGKGDWPSFFGFLVQTVLALGAMGFGIVTSWIFGREYADRTVKDLLALPVPRFAIVCAKFTVATIWNIILSAILFISGFLAAKAFGIPGWSDALVAPFAVSFAKSALLTMALVTPVALASAAGRGYLLPIGYVILALIVTQLIGVGMPSIAAYFPWAFPAVVSGLAGNAIPPPNAASVILYCLTITAGFFGTLAWWRYADHT
jgi:ABC-2 type transport system permease protein